MNETTANVISFQRNGKILTHKFMAFLLPSVLTSAATSLSCFLDSFVVAQTLGSTAMSMVNLASPVSFVMSAIYSLFGEGGSVVYAYFKGRMDKEQAKKIFTLTMLVVMTLGLLVSAIGFIFTDEIAGLLASGLQQEDEFRAYVRVTMANATVIIPLQTLLMFYAAEGKPQIATVVNIVANVVNIVFDYVYTVWIPLGVKGSALATVTGYVVGLGVVFVLCTKPQNRLPFSKLSGLDFRFLKQICEKGFAASMNQVGFCIKVHFSNRIATKLAGAAGVTVFSTCFQTVSLISIVIGGILHAMTPMVSSLYSMKDYNGIRLLMKNVIKVELIVSLAFCAFVEFAPNVVFALYKVTDAEALAIGIPALRIFGLMYLFRQTVLVFMYLYQTMGKKAYAMPISIFDGFAGIVLYALIFTQFFAIRGLWMAYPACALTLLLVILLVGLNSKRLSHGKYHGLFMLPAEDGIDFSLRQSAGSLSEFIETMGNSCLAKGIDRKKANLATVACEEICVYFHAAAQSMDVFTFINGENIEMHFRCLGAPMDFLSAPREAYSNIDVLMKIAKEVKYDYVMGMNQTVVTV